MSDYISKSALIEQIKLYENELQEDRELGVDSDDEMMLFAIANQETAIYRIKRCIQHELPTLDKTEIIRKTAERIINRLEYQEKQYESRAEKFAEALNSWEESRNRGKAYSYGYAIEIVKEECGINE